MADQSQGNGAPEAPNGDDAPQYVTADQLNKAITARFGEFTKKSGAVLDDRLSSFEKKLGEMLPKQPDQAADPAKPANILDHPEVKGMAKKLQELEDRARRAEERTAAEEKRAKDMTLRQTVTEAMAGIGVKDPIRAKHAVSYLIREGLVTHDEEGNVVFVEKDGPIAFESGLKTWAKADDAKIYQSSPDVAQAPAGRQQRVAPNGAAPPQNPDDLDFDAKLAIAQQAIAKSGFGLT